VTRVAVATTSAIAADAAREVADAGGNAVDCALATAIMSMNTEPGVCALAGGAYVTVWAPGHDPVTFDGNHGVPGHGLPVDERGKGKVPVRLDYGGGVSTIVGAGSVAVPGALAAVDKAWQRFGKLPWNELFRPTIEVVRSGFPLPAACRYYLGYSGDLIFGRSSDGYAALHDEHGQLHVRQGGGAMTRDDLAGYEAVERPALVADIDDWHIATNPAPAVGGAVLTAMLLACGDLHASDWDRQSLDKLIRVQRACLDFRRDRLDVANDVPGEAAELVRAAKHGQLLSQWSSSSTVHTSAVDDSGVGCAVTASSGYGSGEMPDGTGLWLNNGLGEIELNHRHSPGPCQQAAVRHVACRRDCAPAGSRRHHRRYRSTASRTGAGHAGARPAVAGVPRYQHVLRRGERGYIRPPHGIRGGCGRSPRGRRVSLRCVIPCRSFDNLRRC
jgi:gamma-glutamyltranspeptidase/glutathione hydrolase